MGDYLPLFFIFIQWIVLSFQVALRVFLSTALFITRGGDFSWSKHRFSV
jgi:hypothetical protein